MRVNYILLAALGIQGMAVAQFKPSDEQQVELGQEAKAQVYEDYDVLPDSDPRVQELRRIGKRLLAQIPAEERAEAPWKWSFDVIASDEVNAFAIPGGPIFFFTGLLDLLKTEDQVAGILAHEMMHIRNEHWASRYADNQKRRLGLFALLSIFGAGDVVFDIANVGDALFTLDYSRRHEDESDEEGYELVADAGYNPQGMADVFRILAEEGSGTPLEILSTHPDARGRAEEIEERIAESGRNFPPQTPRRTHGNVLWRERIDAGLLRKKSDPPTLRVWRSIPMLQLVLR